MLITNEMIQDVHHAVKINLMQGSGGKQIHHDSVKNLGANANVFARLKTFNVQDLYMRSCQGGGGRSRVACLNFKMSRVGVLSYFTSLSEIEKKNGLPLSEFKFFH